MARLVGERMADIGPELERHAGYALENITLAGDLYRDLARPVRADLDDILSPERAGERFERSVQYGVARWCKHSSLRKTTRAEPYPCSAPPALSSAHSMRQSYSSRSEEHTSELQSLMRNSYAVF